ncbi:MAG: DNA-protecting protein DprA [Clostridiales bacterium]|jgi:predicted Rossmann fold nucleotide-binding protein DprA/Smf involved in DNA uptake|nr:DNA-protecting protein DprA [Clostridiales bacterium]
MKRPQAFFDTDGRTWRAQLGLSDDIVVKIEKLMSRAEQLEMEIQRLNSMGILVTTRAEANYPVRLKTGLKHMAPVVLYMVGDAEILNSSGVAIVGSRIVDKEGAGFTQALAKRFAAEGLTMVSGGTAGVDTIAQKAVLQAGGKAVIVLADGIETRINKPEYREPISKGQLIILSSVHPKAQFKVHNAMERSKYIYALANYGVVISSGFKKGSTWAGATENIRAGWAPLFVRLGERAPEGNHKLIELGGISFSSNLLKESGLSLQDWFYQQVERKSGFRLYPADAGPFTKDGEFPAGQDLYQIVWPFIKKALTQPIKERELARIFHVRPIQMRDWLDCAVEEGNAVKHRDGYLPSDSFVQTEIFDIDN